MSNNSNTLSQDTAFDLLSNARRRLAIQYLQEQAGPVSIGELATHVAAMENDIPIEEVDAQQRKRTYVSLYQTHVPKLAKAGAIDYDPDEGIVELNGDVRAITSYLSPQQSYNSWPRYYLALASIGLVVYLVAVLLEPIEHAVVGLIVILLFIGLSATHYWYARKNGWPTINVRF